MKILFKTVLALLLSGIAIAFIAWRDADDLLQHPLAIQQTTDTEIRPGESLTILLQRLADQQILAPRRVVTYLRIYARLSGKGLLVKAGEYELQPGMNSLDLLNLLLSGKVKLHELQITEGWTFNEALEAIHESPDLVHTLKNLAPDQIMTYLGKADQHPEGRIFPDTYRFSKGTTDVALLHRAMDMMQSVLAEEWQKREENLPYASPEEALTMASIVEKETGRADERSRVAGVFVRRLRLGMRLQTDPTVIYGMGAQFDGNIRRKDLLSDTPYNSYTRYGLPPTPICLPGRASIHAALHPDKSQALYFVARKDGGHAFSDTLAQHNRAVHEFQIKKHK